MLLHGSGRRQYSPCPSYEGSDQVQFNFFVNHYYQILGMLGDLAVKLRSLAYCYGISTRATLEHLP